MRLKELTLDLSFVARLLRRRPFQCFLDRAIVEAISWRMEVLT